MRTEIASAADPFDLARNRNKSAVLTASSLAGEALQEEKDRDEDLSDLRLVFLFFRCCKYQFVFL